MSGSALIVGAAPELGAATFYRRLLQAHELVVACDAAAEWCVSLGRRPDAAVGDFDSAAPGAVERLERSGIPVSLHPVRKDQTDLEIATRHACAIGATRLVFTASFRDRLDHTLAALGTVMRHASHHPMIEEPSFTAWLLSQAGRSQLTFDAPAGVLFSVVALQPVSGLRVTGARYSADGIDVAPLDSRTISNETAGCPVTVDLAEGAALVMLMRSRHNGIQHRG